MERNEHKLGLVGNFNLNELRQHLSNNGYKTEVDTALGILSVPATEYYEVKTILTDRCISFMDNVAVEYELTKNYTEDKDGNHITEDTFIVPESWLREYWEKYKDVLPTKAESFADFLDLYAPQEDGQMIFDAACFDGVVIADGMSGR